MMNNFTFQTVFVLIGCLAGGLGYAWLLYGNVKHLEARFRFILSLLRVAVVSVLLWLLFSPLYKKITYVLEKPIIVVAHDNSQSMKHVLPKNYKYADYQKDISGLVNRLADKYEVRQISFSDSIKSGLDFTSNGRVSNASKLVQYIKDDVLNRNVGAVILASDGIFNRGGNPLFEAKKINVPFYTIAMGDTIAKRDLSISDVVFNNLVYLDNEFIIEVELQANFSEGERTRLSVFEDGIKIKEETVAISSQNFVQSIPVKLKASKVGLHRYTISVSPLANEITDKNNTQNLIVEVIDARQKVLILANGPHPDIATIKQAIENNPNYEVSSSLAEESASLNFADYSLLILYQFSHFTASQIEKLKQSKLPIWHIWGAQTNLNEVYRYQNLVKLSVSNNAMQEVLPVYNNQFSLFTLQENSLTQLSNYDPLVMPFGNLSINGNFTSLLNQKIGRVTTASPLLFFTNEDGVKAGYLLGEGIWKWKLEEAKSENSYPLLQELIGKTVQFLTVKDDKRKFKVYPSKSSFDETERIIINANLYNEAYEPVNDPEVEIQIKNENDKTYKFNFSKSGNAYRLDVGNLPVGHYRFLASTKIGDKKYEASGLFYVNHIIAEFQQTTANHQLLNSLSSINSGKMYMPHDISKLGDELLANENLKTISYEDRRYEELIDFKWIFALILGLLSAEWFLRKRNGEV